MSITYHPRSWFHLLYSRGLVLTLGVVKDTLDEYGVLGDTLSDQQDALLDAMATQQVTPTHPLNREREREIKDETEGRESERER